ncbi:hypothetical protein SKAU_G00185710 [Synaphobranchus kaupii]|uniref:Uncharacterized protein n=1 Tax=Synaphobranchus kaupii TaxID=118154 RepID=A0A9Q1IUP2_SYNKA|nr:hypothetical protein SKAU_G00185710 [Synaphobranchus kaupii]
MPFHMRLEGIPIDALYDYKEKYALLTATATGLQNDQRHNLIQEHHGRFVIPYNYISFGGQHGTHILRNTCVLDSLLAGCHICANVHPNIRELFMQDSTINAVMILLDNRMYTEAKSLWIINLDLREGCRRLYKDDNFIDIRGYIKDHLPNFLNLTSAKFHYDDDRRSPNPEDDVYHKTVSKFEALGEVRALGPRTNPQLILVDVDARINGFPALVITDDYGREFKVQFLLLGMITADSNHMVLYTSLNEGWWLYDDMKNPLFRAIAMEDIQTQDYVVYLAAYVNVSTGSKTERPDVNSAPSSWRRGREDSLVLQPRK